MAKLNHNFKKSADDLAQLRNRLEKKAQGLENLFN